MAIPKQVVKKSHIGAPEMPSIIRVTSIHEMSQSEQVEIYNVVTEKGVIVIDEHKNYSSKNSIVEISRIFGNIIYQRWSNSQGVHPIYRIPGFPQYANLRTDDLLMHTDGSFEKFTPKIMLIRCEIPCPFGGGRTRLAYADHIIDDIIHENASDITGLFLPDAMEITRDDKTSVKSVISKRHGYYNMIFRGGDDISIRVHHEATAGVNAITKYLNTSGNYVEFMLEAGQTIVMDNTRVLHGRTAFLPHSCRRLHGLWCDGQVWDFNAGFQITKKFNAIDTWQNIFTSNSNH